MSFSFAADIAKQLISLSTAIVTLCVVLADKLFASQAIKDNSMVLLIALGLFVLSILFGLLCMMAITGTLGRPKTGPESKDATKRDEQQPAEQHDNNASSQDPNRGTIYQSNISTMMIMQILVFLAGIILSVMFLWFASCAHSELDALQSEEDQTANSIRVERMSNFTVIDSVKVDTLLLNE